MTFKDKTEAQLELKSEVNIMNQAFVLQLDLKIRKTNVGTQIINSTTLKTYGIVVFIFSISNKNGREWFL